MEKGGPVVKYRDAGANVSVSPPPTARPPTQSKVGGEGGFPTPPSDYRARFAPPPPL